MLSSTVILAALTGFFHATVLPILISFGGWIAAGATGLLAFLFSANIRKYTIAVIAVFVILVVVWFNGYQHGSSGPAPENLICKEPAFTQLQLTGKVSTRLKDWAVAHNALGHKLGCW